MQSHLRLVYVIVVVVAVVVLVIVVVVGVIVIVAHLVVVRSMEGHLHVVQQRGMIRRGLCGHACAFIHSLCRRLGVRYIGLPGYRCASKAVYQCLGVHEYQCTVYRCARVLVCR